MSRINGHVSNSVFISFMLVTGYVRVSRPLRQPVSCELKPLASEFTWEWRSSDREKLKASGEQNTNNDCIKQIIR